MRLRAGWLAGAFPITESSRRWSGVGLGAGVDRFVFNLLGVERYLKISVNAARAMSLKVLFALLPGSDFPGRGSVGDRKRLDIFCNV